jgi:stringent starvation protein B
MDVRDPESKKAVLTELLEQGMVLITLDARSEGVDVPQHLRDDAQLRLNLSYRFGLPMQIDDEGVRATLTFAGTPYHCCLPWSSMYLFLSHVGGKPPILFPADVPMEFASGLLARVGSPSSASQPNGRPRLRVVARAAEAAPEGARQEDPQPRTPPRRGHLRVVK